MRVLVLVFVSVFGFCFAKDGDKNDQFIIACHSTDFECFKRQYRSLRDNALLGNEQLSIPPYEPYIFSYGDSGTCIKMSGLEESELAGFSLDSNTRQFNWTLQLPLKIQQIRTNSPCETPEKPFVGIPYETGPLKKFNGNATIMVMYPYELREIKGDLYMVLDTEHLDVVLDIPDLSSYDRESELETKLYEWSEWAYEVVQHVDAAENFALPYTSRFRTVSIKTPIKKLILLYPEEDYNTIQFSFSDPDVIVD